MIRLALLLALVAPATAQHAVNPERSTDRPIDDVAPATPLAIYGGIVHEEARPDRFAFILPYDGGAYSLVELLISVSAGDIVPIDGHIYSDGEFVRVLAGEASPVDGWIASRVPGATRTIEGYWSFLGTVVGETPTPILGFQAAGWRAWAPFHPHGFTASWSCNEGRRGTLDARLLWCGGGASSALLPGLLDLAR